MPTKIFVNFAKLINNLNIKMILYITLLILLILGCNEPEPQKTFNDILHTEDSSIKINNYICLVDNVNNRLFSSININEIGDFIGKIKYPINYEISIENNLVYSNQSYDFGEITIGEPISITITKSDTLIINYDLIFTTLSTVSISSLDSIIDEPKVSSKIIINDIENNEAFQMFAGIEIRGGSSQWYQKKSYDIEFWTDSSSFETKKESLFNLRNDDDWHLDAMFIDLSRSRNILGMDIWSLFGRSNHLSFEDEARLAQRGHLVEVILNDEYVGIYSMNEQLDRKQLKLSADSGLLYKTTSWSDEILFTGINSEPEASSYWEGYVLKYPDLPIEENWNPLYDLVNLVAYSNDEEFINNIDSMIDIDNAIDYWLFVNAIQANDNGGKNMFIYRYKIGEPLAFTAWDLDLTFGNRNTIWTENVSDERIISNNLFGRLYDLNPSDYKSKVKARWEQLYSNNLYFNIEERLNKKINKIITSGANNRENNRWDIEIDYSQKLQYIVNWLEIRLHYFDNYINQYF